MDSEDNVYAANGLELRSLFYKQMEQAYAASRLHDYYATALNCYFSMDAKPAARRRELEKRLRDNLPSAQSASYRLELERINEIEKDLKAKEKKALQSKLELGEMLLESQSAMIHAGIALDLDLGRLQLDDYVTDWDREPSEETLLFELTSMDTNAKEVADSLRFLSPDGLRWMLRIIAGELTVYKEGDILHPAGMKNIDHVCSHIPFRTTLEHGKLKHRKLEPEECGNWPEFPVLCPDIEKRGDLQDESRLCFLDWDKRVQTAKIMDWGNITWFVHERDADGASHPSNLIFFKNWEEEFCKLVLLDNIPYLRNENRPEATAGDWDGRSKSFSFDYLRPDMTKWSAVILGNLIYHFQEGLSLPAQINSELHYITGYDWAYESTLLPYFGATMMSHRLLHGAPALTERPERLFQKTARLRHTRQDVLGAGISERMFRLKLRLGAETQPDDNGADFYHSGTLQYLDWEGRAKEVALHRGALYEVNQKNGSNRLIQGFCYTVPGGACYICAYYNGLFYHYPRENENKFHTDCVIHHLDWDGCPVETSIPKL